MLNKLVFYEVGEPPIPSFKVKANKIIREFLPEYEIFDLTQAVPSYPTFEKIRLFLADRIIKDENLSFYTDGFGLPELREKLPY